MAGNSSTRPVRWCASNERWERQVTGSTGNLYTVRYGQMPLAKFGYGYTCSCKSYHYRNKCRHIDLVKAERCGYGWSALHGNPVPMNETCPQCGDETRALQLPGHQPAVEKRQVLPMVLTKPAVRSNQNGPGV